MKHIAKEDDLVGDYKVTTQLKSNNVYQWVKAINRKNEDLVVLQLLVLNKEEVVPIISKYFETLQPISTRKGLMVFQLMSDYNYPLVVVYSDFSGESLDSAFKRVPERKIEWLKEASEILFALHNKSLVHGCVTPDSFVVVKETVYLMGFGYAPLLQLGDQDALRECRDFLAPEVLDQHSVTSATDVYAFAKTVVHWLPQLKITQWYEKAIEQNSRDRFRDMRELFNELKKTFDILSGSDAHTEKGQERRIDETPEEFQGGQVSFEPEGENKGSLIPKYILTVNVKHSEGGRAEGGGSYLANKKATVTATPNAGWEFQCWTGNLHSAKNYETRVMEMEMDADKEITAQFARISLPSKKKIPLAWLFFILIIVVAGLSGGLYLFTQNDSVKKETEIELLFETAKKPAENAISQTEAAKNLKELYDVRNVWNNTLVQLESGISNVMLSPEQEKILSNYKRQQSAVEARINEEKKNQKLLRDAESIAQNANQKTEIAKTVEDFKVAKSLWEENLSLLQKISPNSFDSENVKELKLKNEEHIQQLEKWIERGCKTGVADFCL